MAAQFIRDETFAFKPISRSGRKTRWSIDDILHEATRDPDHPEAWRHLPDAIRMEPIPLTAMTIEDVRAEALLAAQTGREPNGARFRSTGNALVSRVVSYPVRVDALGYPRADLADMIRAGLDGEAVQDPDVERFLSWARMSVAWSQKDLGGPVGAVMHLDEENGHCHILRPLQVDPETGIASLSFWRPGAAAADLRAAARAEGRKLAGSEVFAVGKAALREVAADYHAAVGVHFGHELMTTAPRKRIPYREQKALTERDRMVAVEAAAVARAQAKKDREALVKAVSERDRALAEARSLSAHLAAASAEVEALKKAARLLLDRSKRWIAALRGDADAKRILVADPAPRIDGALFDDRTPSLDAPEPRRGRAA